MQRWVEKQKIYETVDKVGTKNKCSKGIKYAGMDGRRNKWR